MCFGERLSQAKTLPEAVGYTPLKADGTIRLFLLLMTRLTQSLIVTYIDKHFGFIW